MLKCLEQFMGKRMTLKDMTYEIADTLMEEFVLSSCSSVLCTSGMKANHFMFEGVAESGEKWHICTVGFEEPIVFDYELLGQEKTWEEIFVTVINYTALFSRDTNSFLAGK